MPINQLGRGKAEFGWLEPIHAVPRKRFDYCLLLTAFCLLLVAVRPARAEMKYGLTPAMVVRTFKPGQALEVELDVSNGSASPILMRGIAMDFWYNDKNEKVFAAPGSMPHSASNWIEFVPRLFMVPAEGSAKVKMIVTPPADASGSYYSVAFLESKPELTRPATSEKKALFTNIRLGALIMLAAENSENYKVEISDAKFSPPGPNRDLTLDFLLDNQSNTHVFPRSELALLNADHDLVAKGEGEIKRFLPQQKDRMSVSWNGTLPPGRYTAILTVVYGNDKIHTQEFPFTVSAAEEEMANKTEGSKQ